VTSKDGATGTGSDTSGGVTSAAAGATAGSALVLGTLAAGQFLMTLDSSVMNVSIAYVANDLGTTVSGIQTAITLYTLVMASFMITGGKVGAIIGHRRAFAIGLVIYACGSATTALAPTLGVLIIGWSFLEGLGAALIMPAIVALVAGNFAADKRTSTYGLIAAAGAVAVAAGPLIGGAVTTFASWRWVFAGEVVVVAFILVAVRRIADSPLPETRPSIDLVGSLMSIVGLASVVLGVLRSGTWGWVQPKPGAPEILGLSPVLWLVAGGLLVLWLFLLWQSRLERLDREPLVRPSMLANRQLSGGLTMFGVQFFLQSGIFFTVPLFLSVVLELSAVQTGVRLIPLSIALLLAAVGIPKIWPAASPRRVVRVGLLLMSAGTLVLVGGLDPGASAAIVTVPMVLIGLGIGALASQLGAVTVSAVPDEQSAEVGGLQNTASNLGASLGTALVGSVLLSSLAVTLAGGIQSNPDIPDSVKSQATVQLEGGVPFVSSSQLSDELAATDLDPAVADEIVEENDTARYAALRTALSVVVVVGLGSLFLTSRIPDRAPGSTPTPEPERQERRPRGRRDPVRPD
jgi:MFS family permease